MLVIFCFIPVIIESVSLLSRFPKLEYTHQTREALKGFAPLQDLTLQNICHVIPFNAIEKQLNFALLERNGAFKPKNAVDIDKLTNLRTDIFKVDNEAAYLKQADMRSKMTFYRANTDQRTHYDLAVMKLKDNNTDNQSYNDTIHKIISLLYNAPANLRVSPTPCINGNTRFYEDPNLKFYDGISYTNISDAGFTEQSKDVAKKYNLEILKDKNGFIQTTDRRKVLLNPTLPKSLELINKGLNVFQFLKSKKTYQIENENSKENNMRDKIYRY